MRLGLTRPADEPRGRRAGPAPQARRDYARRRHGAGERDERPPWCRLSFFHVEIAFIGALTVLGFAQFLWGGARWIMAALGFSPV